MKSEPSKPTKRELTHDRIVDAAARALRRRGCDGVGVAEVMKEAGLTHGGFYAHFESRDALLAEALARAGRDSVAQTRLKMGPRMARGESPLRAFLETYLSDAHLSGPEEGCPVAALGSEMSRQPPELLAVSGERVRALIDGVQGLLADQEDAKAKAQIIASTIVGALQLARVLGANAQGRALLGATRKSLLSQYDT
ncbi:TetR/AcrR family transcriptional regulator [Pelomonas sp. KK5]|uniref:TetR/AcrR family transcriptional regulator n=1 Tax=Pelomonas sp. KK5 TaxID=1855730 RepID=UPI00097C5D10|nr:TetR/AcrR family transcriptional regulator [Pelomonas sp. KK5]